MKKMWFWAGMLSCLMLVPAMGYGRDKGVDKAEGDNTRINVKVNGLAVIGVVNPAVEFKVMEHWTAQLEGIGLFYAHGFMGSDKPLTLGATFGEFRYYPKQAFNGFYVAPAVGWGVYRLSKSVIPMYEGDYEDSYQVGSNMMFGVSLGYNWRIGKHWSLEFNIGGGYQDSTYEGFHNDGYRYVGLQGSGEWLPLFKGGLFVGYTF